MDAAPQTARCDRQITAAASPAGAPDAILRSLYRAVRHASALWRFERSDEALDKLDALLVLLAGPRGERLEDGGRADFTKSVQALERCLTGTQPGPLTSITIAVFEEAETTEGGRGKAAGAGVFVDVEGIPVGRTGPDGTLEAKLPSGRIEVQAAEYPSSWGHEDVTLSPGESRTISVVMATDKEPSEESDLVFEEAPDDILPADAVSITLRFVLHDEQVEIHDVDWIGLSDVRDSDGENLGSFFRVSNGVMRAADVQAVSRKIAQYSESGRPVWITASGVDAEGRRHYGDVEFQTGLFKLTITLAPPPSNPALSVSNIPVRVSMGGMNIVRTRMSDASGRFDIDWVPDAPIHIDAHAFASGNHYYADATVTPCGDTSATVVLRNVKDLIAGVRGIDSRTPVCAPLPRR